MNTKEEFDVLLTLIERVNQTINYKTDLEESTKHYLVDRDEYGNLGINIYCIGKHMLNLLRHYNDNDYGTHKKLEQEYFINDFYELHKSFKCNYNYTNLLMFYEAFKIICSGFNTDAYRVMLELINETCDPEHVFDIYSTKIVQKQPKMQEITEHLSNV